MNRLRLEYAAEAFLAGMRKEFLKHHPGQDCPIREFRDYTPSDRSILMRAVLATATAVSPEHDEAFSKWLERRPENAAA
jgi:hypothetical protein